MAELTACMGGFCGARESCRHYHAEGAERLCPAERLCYPGRRDHWAPITIARREVLSVPHALSSRLQLWGAA